MHIESIPVLLILMPLGIISAYLWYRRSLDSQHKIRISGDAKLFAFIGIAVSLLSLAGFYVIFFDNSSIPLSAPILIATLGAALLYFARRMHFISKQL